MAPCRILLAMSSGDSAKVGEENQENLQREDIPETLAKCLQFSFMWSINQAPCSIITVKCSKAHRDPLTKSGKHWDIIAPFIQGGSVTHSARGKIKHCFSMEITLNSCFLWKHNSVLTLVVAISYMLILILCSLLYKYPCEAAGLWRFQFWNHTHSSCQLPVENVFRQF